MSTLPLNDRLTPDVGAAYLATLGQTDFVADFPVIRNGAGAVEGLYVRRVRAGVETILSYQGADFSLVGESDSGFTARLAVASLAGDLVQVFSLLPAARDRAHAPAGQIRTDTLEGDADSLQAQIQELRRDVGRTLKLPLGEAPADFAGAALRKGEAIVFDAVTGAVGLAPLPQAFTPVPILADYPANPVSWQQFIHATLGPQIFSPVDSAWHGIALT